MWYYQFRHPILDYSVCCHPTVMKDMCAECGADLRETKQKSQTTAVVAMVHNIPELMVSMKVCYFILLLLFVFLKFCIFTSMILSKVCFLNCVLIFRKLSLWVKLMRNVF